jgi:hypothetical protein
VTKSKKWSADRWRSDGSEISFPSDPNAAAISADIERHQREQREQAARRAAERKAAAAANVAPAQPPTPAK